MKRILTIITAVTALAMLPIIGISCSLNNPLAADSGFLLGTLGSQFGRVTYFLLKGGANFSNSIYRVKADGSDPKVLATTNIYGTSLTFAFNPLSQSLDEKFVYISGQKLGQSNAVYRLDTDGGNEKLITSDSASTLYSLYRIVAKHLLILETPTTVTTVNNSFVLYSLDGVRGNVVVSDPSTAGVFIGSIFPTSDSTKIFYTYVTTSGVTNFIFRKYDVAANSTSDLATWTVSNLATTSIGFCVSPEGDMLAISYKTNGTPADKLLVKKLATGAAGSLVDVGTMTISTVSFSMSWAPYPNLTYMQVTSDLLRYDIGNISLSDASFTRTILLTISDFSTPPYTALTDKFGHGYKCTTNGLGIPTSVPVFLF